MRYENVVWKNGLFYVNRFYDDSAEDFDINNSE